MEEVVVVNPPRLIPDELSTEKAPVYKKPVAKKRATKSTKKRASYKFDVKKYMVTETYPETIPVRQINARGQMVVENTPTSRFLEREILSDDFIKVVSGGPRNNKKALHHAKCAFRALEFFDVSLEHLTKSYETLSGKRIDGYWATDLIDRFGFSDGEQMSRDMLRRKYNKSSRSVDVAQEKLYDIINTVDVSKAYVGLIKDIKDEFVRDLRDKAVYGESE